MTEFNIAGYLIFAFVTSITPGPNNILLFSYGKNFGFKDSSKLLFGITLGFSIMLYASGYGIAEIITKNTTIGLILKIISSVWLIYLAFLISKPKLNVAENPNTKIGFYQGFLLQFVNPKGWAMAITGAAAFLPQLNNIHLSVLIFTISFGLVGIPCMIFWISFGDLISRVLKSEKANRIIGWILFILMVLSVVVIWV